ncbi:HoxN/HupN/NixA family nickel/cobalt transporter [Mucilaginibacter xinganensis]|uniref:Nickel/cobalt efflux system n=1 Tax=Mucilaginibacter xinganensis TaxID=1234841 RepID=A0A223NTA9_9SPHI|nr:urease accessory protein [Mucilaginibacter xinganensis]ASU33135.1 High-affinity nickel-transport protein [Mucilaginibacter xinganensis]
MFTFPLLLTIYAGFTHAFEADHLLAVTNIVSRRDHIWLSVKDGIFWGLGHSSTILLIGVLMILFKVGISEHSFHYFEAGVGLMLIALAVYRLQKFFRCKKLVIHTHGHTHSHPHRTADEGHKHLHVHFAPKQNFNHTQLQVHTHDHSHKLAFGVGLVHGLAGSGALVVLVMAQIKNPFDGLSYLLIFSAGCIGGMLVAAGLFSVPFSKKLIQAPVLQTLLIIATSVLCIIYGGKVMYDNLLLLLIS